MNEFLSKFSLYDFLTTILLGGIPYIYFGTIDDEALTALYPTNKVEAIGFCYIFGLILHKAIESIDLSEKLFKPAKNVCPIILCLQSPLCRNHKGIVNRARVKIKYNLASNDLMNEYYTIYYSAMANKQLYNIPKLEAHSALLRDLIFTLPLFCFGIVMHYFKQNIQIWWIYALSISLVILVLLIIARYNTEYKIHWLVWENKLFHP